LPRAAPGAVVGPHQGSRVQLADGDGVATATTTPSATAATTAAARLPPASGEEKDKPQAKQQKQPSRLHNCFPPCLGILHSQVRGTQTAPENSTLPRKTPYGRL